MYTPLESKEGSEGEAHIDKVVSIHEYQVYQTCKLCRKDIDMEVSSTPKITKPVSTLVLPNNMANFLTVIKAIIKLVQRYNWT